MFPNNFGLHCSSPLAEEGKGQFLTDFWDRGLSLFGPHMALAHVSRMLISCEVFWTKQSSPSQRVKANPASHLSASSILGGE